eukprot:TRINITY_DN162_c0_g1_i4.p1 TRINITY_DN162_c0_g1~~TRINITY_DN162_c0_g1_i4.p1  ORF type:complete len:664 (+),score=272.91 TRINITY_DN162_c0_g1_i4:45-1994(+)
MLSCLVIALLCSQVFALELVGEPSFATYEGNGAAAGGAAGALDTNVWRLQLFASANVPYEGMSTDQSEYNRGLVSLADSTNDAKISSGIGGNGAAAGGAAGALDTNVWRLQLFASANVPYEGMSTDQSEYNRGLVSLADSTNDAKISSGIGAVEVASGVRAMFLQPASSVFTPGYVEFRLPYDAPATADTILQTAIEFDLWHHDFGSRSSAWKTLYYSGSEAQDEAIEISGGALETPSGDAGSAWEKTSLSLTVAARVKTGDTHFYVRIAGEDADGSGARDAIAISDIIVLGSECAANQHGNALCPCDDNLCSDAFLTCSDGVCENNCDVPGSRACPCIGDERTCAEGLQCTELPLEICTPGGCVPGDPGCICDGADICKTTTCVAGICEEDKCPTGDTATAANAAKCASMCGDGQTVDICLCSAGVYEVTCINNPTACKADAADIAARVDCLETPPETGAREACWNKGCCWSELAAGSDEPWCFKTDASPPTTELPTTTTAPTTWTGTDTTSAGGSSGNATTTAGGSSGNATTVATTSSTAAATTSTTAPVSTPAPCPSDCAGCLARSSDCAWCGDGRSGVCNSKRLSLSCNFAPVTSEDGCPAVETAAPTTAPTTTAAATPGPSEESSASALAQATAALVATIALVL